MFTSVSILQRSSCMEIGRIFVAPLVGVDSLDEKNSDQKQKLQKFLYKYEQIIPISSKINKSESSKMSLAINFVKSARNQLEQRLVTRSLKQ